MDDQTNTTEKKAPDAGSKDTQTGAQQAPQFAAPAVFKKEQDDIARILKEIKLPERHEEKPSAPKKEWPIAKAAAMTLPPQTPGEAKAAVESRMATTGEKPTVHNESDVVAVHTLKDDLQEVVRDKKISLVRAAALESDKKKNVDALTQEAIASQAARHARGRSILFWAGLLIVLGSLALGAVYFVMSAQSQKTPATQESGLLFSEQTYTLPLSSEQPARAIKQQLSQVRAGASLTLGAITHIVPIISPASGSSATQERVATTAEFLNAIGAEAPDELLRALGDEFFFGIHALDKNSPLIVVPVTSYEHAFAGMLAWEPSMNGGLAPIFTPVPSLITTTTGSTTTTVRNTFVDDVMRNFDVRELKDVNGQIELYYSFPSRDILIIAENPYSFAEILSRLRAERRL